MPAERQRIGLDHHDLRMKRRGHGPKVLTASLHVLRLGLIEALKRLDAITGVIAGAHHVCSFVRTAGHPAALS